MWAKRASFTFWVDKSSLKLPKLKRSNETFWVIFIHCARWALLEIIEIQATNISSLRKSLSSKSLWTFWCKSFILPFSNSTEFPSRAFLQPEQNCINYSLLHMYLYFVMHFQCPHGVGALPFGRQLVPHHPAKMQKSNHPSNSTGYVSLLNQTYNFYSLGWQEFSELFPLFQKYYSWRFLVILVLLQLALFSISSFTSVGAF